MSVVDDIEAEIQRQFEMWATVTCPTALVNAIEASCTHGAHRTGGLAGSVGSTKVSDELYHVGTSAYYGNWVDSGRGTAKPHGNYPLHWTAPSGADVFARSSRPSTPRRFIVKAVASLS